MTKETNTAIRAALIADHDRSHTFLMGFPDDDIEGLGQVARSPLSRLPAPERYGVWGT
jgi:hypothetical protein